VPEVKLTVIDALDASRMTAPTSSETAHRVKQYFGDAGPFSYQKVRRLTAPLLEGALPYDVTVAGLRAIKFDLAKKCNLEVAELVAECDRFRGRNFYRLKRVLYPIDRKFAVSLRPETICAVDGRPNLIFLQPRKTPTPWAYNASFLRRILEETYVPDYFEDPRFWLVDTEADEEGDRRLDVVDLQSVAPMSDREFIRRIAALRTAWRLHLKDRSPRPPRPSRPDDRQTKIEFDDDE
jgi:hypothetical protein